MRHAAIREVSAWLEHGEGRIIQGHRIEVVVSRNTDVIPIASTTVLIVGLRNNGCCEFVTKVLEGIPGVRYVQVNLYRASARVVHQAHCTGGDLIAAIEQSGYGASLATPSTRQFAANPDRITRQEQIT